MNTITCPDCGKKLRLKAEIAAGARVKCPGCATTFVPAEEDEPEEPEPERPAKSRIVREPDEDEEDLDDEPEPRPARRKRPRKKAPKKGSKVGLIIGLAILGGVVLVGGVVALFMLSRSSTYSKQEAAAKDIIKLLNEFADALESVKDPESAKSAAARIDKICDRLDELGKRAQALPKLTQAEDTRLRKQIEPELNQVNERIVKVAFQAGLNSKGEPAFMSSLQKLQQVVQRYQTLNR